MATHGQSDQSDIPCLSIQQSRAQSFYAFESASLGGNTYLDVNEVNNEERCKTQNG